MANRSSGQEFETTVDVEESDLKRISESNGVQYKFFVAQKSSSTARPLFLKFIEYNWRQLDEDKLIDTAEVNDRWPNSDLENRPTRVDSGWLIDHREHEIQFHFFDLPLELWTTAAVAERGEVSTAPELTFSIVPFKHTTKGLAELKDYLVVTNVY